MRRGPKPAAQASEPQADPLLAAGRELRLRREARGLTLRDLALETRISTPVLEALERGWRDRLPEAAYLRTMLPLIERHLELEPGSLELLLPATGPATPGRQRSGLLRRFTPGSIEVYSSWQGTVLYGLLTLGLIYGLNMEQQRLAAQGLLTLRPIPPLPPSEQQKPTRPEASLLGAMPELRPLERATLQEALRRVGETRPSAKAYPAPESHGVLVLRLQQPTRVSLRSGRGARTDLQGARGELALPIEEGFQLQLEPPPANTADPTADAPAVEWNGAPLAPLPGQPAGRYAVGAGATPRP
jgi:transcriptional regulator with XRE-family HTH domain